MIPLKVARGVGVRAGRGRERRGAAGGAHSPRRVRHGGHLRRAQRQTSLHQHRQKRRLFHCWTKPRYTQWNYQSEFEILI